MVIFRSRDDVGLGLVHVKYKAMAEFIRSFLETSLVQTFHQKTLSMQLNSDGMYFYKEISQTLASLPT